MARNVSVAIGGYYPTVTSLLPLLASLLQIESGESGNRCNIQVLDPCAGDGAAILGILQEVVPNEKQTMWASSSVGLYAIELERSRYDALKTAESPFLSWHTRENQLLRGDAFCVSFENDKGIGLLFLNPPYDTDPVCGRLEEKFLRRFTETLAPGGVLMFLVPFYALKASAETLARKYDAVHAFRFPEAEFSAFRQVVVVATRRSVDGLDPDPAIMAQVLAWASDASCMPELTHECVKFTVPSAGGYGRAFSEWTMRNIDIDLLLATTRPWHMTDRSGRSLQIPTVFPEGTLEDALARHYPIAMPPRPAHIAAGIAAGVFNGARIEPDRAVELPAILVKGVFDREFRTVDEKQDKDGNVKGVIQVQQPRLVTTVLDLREKRYVTIQPRADETGSRDLTTMTMADMLSEYGRGLMDVMLRQCPVLHDPRRPEDEIPLPEVARPLYEAQSHAAQAGVKLLGGLNAKPKDRKFKACFVLGEIGSGKTSVSITIASAIKAKRILVVCPPHLLQSWSDQIDEVVPWMRTQILSDVGDVETLAADPDERAIISILSRETAKLGHGIEGVSGTCPRCGTPVDPKVDHAKKRSRCAARRRRVKGPLGKLVERLALKLLWVFPNSFSCRQVLGHRRPIAAFMKRSEEKRFNPAAWAAATDHFDEFILSLIQGESVEREAAMALLVADPRRDRVISTARTLLRMKLVEMGQNVLHLIAPGPDLEEALEEFRVLAPSSVTSYEDIWVAWGKRQKYLWEDGPATFLGPERVQIKNGERTWQNKLIGTPYVANMAIDNLLPKVVVDGKKECGEPLFQAIPEPRRYPLATLIARRYPDLFDMLILDEVQEYSQGASAQSKAAHRLTALGIPTLELTGTAMNGYASSLFHNTWAASPKFRAEFDREDEARFIDRYGYRKRIVEDRDQETGKVVTYGSMTDRVERSERVIGNAPGVLPLFVLRHLLPLAVTLHKADLSVEIPDCTETVDVVEPGDELSAQYKSLETALLKQVAEDRFEAEFAGKLWGAVANLPSFMDLATADTGNYDGGCYSIRYPESVGGKEIARAVPLPASAVLPKERWLLNQVQSAIDDGRNVLVFAWHTRLLPRLARLISTQLDMPCPILDPAKVPTKKRQAWIDAQVVAKRHRVLVVNPVTIQTGLNNLVYFSDQVWMENPGCNPIVYRQGVGRVDRIGQKDPTRIFFPLYSGIQQALHSLLMTKVAVSMSTDGLDAEGALRAAGVGDTDHFSTFAVGRQLYEMIQQGQVPRGTGRILPVQRTQQGLFQLAQEMT